MICGCSCSCLFLPDFHGPVFFDDAPYGPQSIPARIIQSPRNAARTLITQINENAGRKDTTLWEDATAIEAALQAWKAEHPRGKVKAFAAEFGRSPAWVSQHLAVARATGCARIAVLEGHLRHAEAFRLFAKLPGELQRELLRHAKTHQAPISVGFVRASTPAEPAKAKRSPRPGGNGGSAAGRSSPEKPAPPFPNDFHH